MLNARWWLAVVHGKRPHLVTKSNNGGWYWVSVLKSFLLHNQVHCVTDLLLNKMPSEEKENRVSKK